MTGLSTGTAQVRSTSFAMIGNGFARQHLAWLAEVPRARVEVLCHASDGQAARSTAAQYAIPRVSTQTADAFEGGIDVVSIVTPVDTHADLVLRALAAGSAVVCDKPLAMTVDEAVALASAADGTSSMVMFQWRFHPAVDALRELVGTGRLGAVVDVTASFDHDFLASPEQVSTWRHDPARAGAGALADQGVHLFDLLEWITAGDYRVTDAAARVVHPVRDDGSRPVMCGTEDVATVLLASTRDAHLAQVRVSRVSGGLRRLRIAVHGTQGFAELEIDPETEAAALRDGPDDLRRWSPGSLRNPYEALLASRDGLPVSVPTFWDAVRAQSLLEAATALTSLPTAVPSCTTEKEWIPQ